MNWINDVMVSSPPTPALPIAGHAGQGQHTSRVGATDPLNSCTHHAAYMLSVDQRRFEGVEGYFSGHGRKLLSVLIRMNTPRSCWRASVGSREWVESIEQKLSNLTRSVGKADQSHQKPYQWQVSSSQGI